ncbi:MAG: nitroreductase [Lysobacter sp.]|nr:nitroreductase [Lysobacter sp.]MDQ3206361.1 nitroreductase [Pseudomonadota bacterium]
MSLNNPPPFILDKSPIAIDLLDSRRSLPPMQLAAPGPDDATLLRLLQSAVRVPDHGKRVPFRFVTLRGDARHTFGERLAARREAREPGVGEAAIEKDRARFSHAPLVVTVVARLGPDPKIPEQERLLSAGCVCFGLLHASHALGFAAVWLTGWPAYDAEVAGWLGLSADERVVGFVHIGTPQREPPERDRPDPLALLSQWSPS